MKKFNWNTMGMAVAMKNVIKGLSQYINGMKIKRQLLLAYLVVGIIPILLIGIYLVDNMRNIVMQQQISETRDESIKVENSLIHLTDLVTDISNTFFYDGDLRNIISEKYPDAYAFVTRTDSYTEFTTVIQNYSEIKDIMIYSENSSIFDSKHFRTVTSEIKKANWYKKASHGWQIIWMNTTDTDGEQYLGLARQIFTGNNEKAVLVINVSRDYLYSLVGSDALTTVAAVQNGSIVLSNNYNDYGRRIFYNVPEDAGRKIRQIKINNKAALAALESYKPMTSNNYFSILTLNYQALKRVNDATSICIIILLLSIIVPFLLILYFSNVFSRRVNLLRSEMNRAAGGDLAIPSNPGGNDEISELYTDLNVMIDGIKNLVNEVYMEKLIKERMINSQQKIEFKMLASQINPHFLYNTLETIRMKLICNGDRETANVIKILGKTIRRMLEVKDEAVTLDSELEYIKYYLEIQRFRFGSRIEYEINIDDNINAKEIYILPLLLQPIVENAFVHGLEDKAGGGKITVDIHEADDMFQILVDDNGMGMSQEKCDFLNSSLQSMGSGNSDSNINGSIGLCNVHQRITLYYGQKYGIKLTSKLDNGTKVLINLPSDGEVMIDYEGTDHRR